MHELEKGRTENQDPIWDKRDRPVKRRIEREEQKGKNRNPKPQNPKTPKPRGRFGKMLHFESSCKDMEKRVYLDPGISKF